MTIHESIRTLFREQAQHFGDRPCFLFPHAGQGASPAEVTYGAIFDLACRMEHYLEELELAPGSSVALLHHRAWQAFPLLAACAARGLTLAPLNPDLHPDELRDTLIHSGAELVIGDMPEGGLPKSGRARHVTTLSAFCEGAARCAPDERPALAHDHPALLIYTSGTTGGSKAVMLPERSLLFAAASTARFYGLTPDDRVFGVLPYHHMNAVMASGLIPMSAGAQVCVGDSFGFTNAKFYWNDVARLGVTVPSLTPSIMSMLLKLNPHGTTAALDDVRFAWCGAAPLPESLWREFEERFGVPVYQGYGLTETSFWTVCIPPDVPRHYDTVGIPVDCEIRIDTDVLTNSGGEPAEEAWEAPEQATPAAAQPPLGEILIRSGGLMSGYFRNRKLTSAVMTPDGFLRTGDIGYLDEEGYLRIVGRKKEIIIRNGINILPDELDAVIQRHPAVRECKTIGVADDLLGERIVTVCVLADAPESADPRGSIRSYAREHLSGFKRPDDIIILAGLPRGVTGKVSSATLRRIVTGEVTDEIVGALTRRKFRRAEPKKISEIRELVDRAVRSGEPLRFVKYWGVGDRDSLNEADELGLRTLQELVAAVSVIPQVTATLNLILNNMHGRMNGRVPERAAAYLSQIAAKARAAGFTVEFEDAVWEAGGLDLDAITREASTPERRAWFASLPVNGKLAEQATKHSRLRAGEEGARLYATACQHANRVLEERYAGHIFLTYNPPEMDLVSPDLPRLYIFPHRRGNSDKPWFTP